MTTPWTNWCPDWTRCWGFWLALLSVYFWEDPQCHRWICRRERKLNQNKIIITIISWFTVLHTINITYNQYTIRYSTLHIITVPHTSLKEVQWSPMLFRHVCSKSLVYNTVCFHAYFAVKKHLQLKLVLNE